ncbi:MAG: class I adenylate-forming enzyme family protein [Bulleidia sp.]
MRRNDCFRASDFQNLLDHSRMVYGTLPALKSGTETYTYHELISAIDAEAERLQNEPAFCIAIDYPETVKGIIAIFASVLAGKRTVLLDSHLSAERKEKALRISHAELILPGNIITREEPVPGEAGKLLFFSSGTSASEKAVVLSQRALCSSAWNGQSMLSCNPGDTVGSLLPLSHVFGFVCTLLWPIAYGACIGLGRGYRHLIDDASYYHVTILPLVPTLLDFLAGHGALNPELKTILVGAGPADPAVLKKVSQSGIMVSFGYGLTETASGLAISAGKENPLAMDLCPDTSVRIGGDHTVYVRTPCMMDGYYEKPEETAAVLKDGELDTGDLGELDEEHCLHLSGRKNDVLVLNNGMKVFCPEWEAELSKLLQGEAAIALQDGKLVLHVCTALADQEVRAKADEFNDQQPAGRKLNMLVRHTNHLPRTATGKLQRWKLNEEGVII